MISLQELQNTYGDFSVESIINRWENFPFKENNFPNFPQEDKPKESDEVDKPDEINETNVSDEIYKPVQKNKFSPVNIANSRDWAELRAEVLDLHELKNFFVGKQDSQSPKFLNLIEKYMEVVEKKLVSPQEIDEESSNKFVADLAEIIEKRFYTILTSCVRGKSGKGEMSAEYYAEIFERIKKYFERIGLKSENVKRFDDYRQWTEKMKAVEIPANQVFQDKKIAEVEVQPHYFEYHGDDGEVNKFYIDGKCSVYKF